MKPAKSLRSTLTWSMILIALFSVGMIGSFWISQEYQKFNKELLELKGAYIAEQKTAVRQAVDRAMAYIDFKRKTTEQQLKDNIKARVYEAIAVAENIYRSQQGQKSDTEIIELIKEALRPLRFNEGRGYFFIYDMQGNNILFPSSPLLEGEKLWDLQDSNGFYTIRETVEMVREDGEGFLRWHWYKPGEKKKMSEKIGFSKYFEPFGWFIGTGEYVDDFTKGIQQETLAWINKIRFGEDGYIFIYDFKGVTLAHYDQKSLGADLWDFKNSDGTYVFRELIRVSQQDGGGFLHYDGIVRPSTGLPAPKIAYTNAVTDWQWTVGAGVYVDSINAVVEKSRQALKRKISRNIGVILVILCISLLIIFSLLRYIVQKTSDNLAVFTNFFEKAATESMYISDHSVHFSEFKSLAHSANQMVAESKKVAVSLDKMQEQLIRSRKMEALGVLAGGVAHDLNNVLSAIVGYPDLILESLPKESVHRKYILTIKESGMKAAAIVQDLLTLARRGVAQRVALNLNSIIENYLESPEHQKIMQDNEEVKVTVNLDPNLLMINGSQVHLQKTLMNLVANAAEAQPNGGEIHITTANLYMESKTDRQAGFSEGEYIYLAVKDRGMGIDKVDLEHIFEPFFSKKHPGKSGTGLGMAVVWGTVQDHDGYINVDTDENKGTIFELYFPAIRGEILDMSVVGDINSLRGNGETILVVDDLREQRELANAILSQLGYSVETAASGEAALEYISRHQVDLLLLDMIMDPGIDGLETFKRVLPLRPDQRAIITSGYTETDRVKAAIALGVGQYVKKPYTFNSIGRAVKEELQRR